MQPEGHGGPCAMGEQGSAPSGVYDYGTLEEDGPDTWEGIVKVNRLEPGRKAS